MLKSGDYTKERAIQVINSLSTSCYAMIECSSDEEDECCREFLHAAGRSWGSQDSYFKRGYWKYKTRQMRHRFNEGTYSSAETGERWDGYAARLAGCAMTDNAYYQWSEIADLLDGSYEDSIPSEEEVLDFLFGD